ncbi:hypothetical protein LDG_7970 [Legionella drancourtii LLAP12]|uniref:Uncharacterized protein n=1 Tax=Legionella drancourtii LLAP12 TaxID=658187 RepID=G9ERQ2_9GAMM|nr:hypothetical protein LDG_7970 [Legionella drancourtii LLAP12]
MRNIHEKILNISLQTRNLRDGFLIFFIHDLLIIFLIIAIFKNI